VRSPKTQSPLLAQRAFSQEERETGLVFARTDLRGFLAVVMVFLEELGQALDQAAATADHVQPALMLMFFQNVVQFILEIGH
jgi:hypothetical protein